MKRLGMTGRWNDDDDGHCLPVVAVHSFFKGARLLHYYWTGTGT